MRTVTGNSLKKASKGKENGSLASFLFLPVPNIFGYTAMS